MFSSFLFFSERNARSSYHLRMNPGKGSCGMSCLIKGERDVRKEGQRCRGRSLQG